MSRVTDNYKKHTVGYSFWQFKFLQKLLIDNYLFILLREVKNLKPENVLEVGCGEGFILEKLKNEKACKKLFGVDISKDAINLAKKIHPGLDLKEGNIYNLPYKDNSFDLVICAEVLEHLEKPIDAMNEIKRVCKKNLLLSVPNEPLFRIGNFTRGKNWSRFGNDIDHIQHWSENSFRKFVGKFLKVKKVVTPLPWIFVIAEK